LPEKLLRDWIGFFDRHTWLPVRDGDQQDAGVVLLEPLSYRRDFRAKKVEAKEPSGFPPHDTHEHTGLAQGYRDFFSWGRWIRTSDVEIDVERPGFPVYGSTNSVTYGSV